MTQIFVNCPRNGTPVPTGLMAEWVVLDSLPVTVPLLCPSCGATHHWRPEDAWVGTLLHPPPPDAGSRARTGEPPARGFAHRFGKWNREV